VHSDLTGHADCAHMHRIDAAIQDRALVGVLYVPLGRYLQKSAWRSNVSGVLKASAPVFRNARKT
jgi:hypothetical protein